MLLCECFPTCQRNYFSSTHREPEDLNSLKFPEIHRKRRFIIALTKASHWYSSHPDEFIPRYRILFIYDPRSCYSHLFLAVSSDLVPSGFLTTFCMLKLPPRFTSLTLLESSSLIRAPLIPDKK